MDVKTRSALVALNQRFYHHHADAFSRSRRQGWPGWERLLVELPPDPLSWLDIGCGNGRLALWLLRQGRRFEHYLGLDHSADLLADARRDLNAWREKESCETELIVDFEVRDVVGRGVSLPQEGFDAVALMAVLHHVPGFEQRRQLLLEAAQAVKPGGLLVASLWRFDRAENWRRKRLPWEALRGCEISFDQLETGDHLLTFGGDQEHPRYCHLMGEAETESLISAIIDLDPGWRLAERYDADGRSGRDNHYLIFRS